MFKKILFILFIGLISLIPIIPVKALDSFSIDLWYEEGETIYPIDDFDVSIGTLSVGTLTVTSLVNDALLIETDSDSALISQTVAGEKVLWVNNDSHYVGVGNHAPEYQFDSYWETGGLGAGSVDGAISAQIVTNAGDDADSFAFGMGVTLDDTASGPGEKIAFGVQGDPVDHTLSAIQQDMIIDVLTMAGEGNNMYFEAGSNGAGGTNGGDVFVSGGAGDTVADNGDVLLGMNGDGALGKVIVGSSTLRDAVFNVQGVGNDATTYSILAKNSDSTKTFSIDDLGNMEIGGSFSAPMSGIITGLLTLNQINDTQGIKINGSTLPASNFQLYVNNNGNAILSTTGFLYTTGMGLLDDKVLNFGDSNDMYMKWNNSLGIWFFGKSSGGEASLITTNGTNMVMGSYDYTGTIGKVTIDGDTSDNTKYAQVWRNSGSTVMGVVRNDGKFGIGTNAPDTQLHTTGGRSMNVTTVNAATYDLLITDHILNVTYTGTGAVTSLTLPTAQTTAGRVIVIKDAGGNASANNITIDTEGSETIDGSATAILGGDYDSITLYSDGSNWFII